MRDRLIEIIKNAPRNTKAFNDQYADYLLKNDVEPVVRCRDCKYAKKVIHRGEEMPDIFRCTYLRPNTTLFDIDFCRYGKRRDTE